MPTPTSTTLDALLIAIVDRLVAEDLFKPQLAFISLTPEILQYPASDQFIMITPGRQEADLGITRGANNDSILYFKGEFHAYLYGRLDLDEYPRDTSYLTDANLGLLVTMRKVISALQLYQPIDQDQMALIAEPMRLMDIESFKKVAADYSWGVIKLKYWLRWKFQFSR